MKRRSYLTTHSGYGGGGLFSSLGKFLVALLALIVLLALILRVAAPGALTFLAAPAWRAGNALTAASGNLTLASRAALIRERDQYARENEALRAENSALAARAGDLERLLGGRPAASEGILAGVLARAPVAPYDVLIIDRGTESGIRVGSTAYGPGGVPVGTVTEASSGSARVTLYSTTGAVHDAWAGAARVPLRLSGVGAGAFDAEVPGSEGVLVGDAVYVPGPGALPIGSVSEVVTDPSSPNVLVRVRPLVNPFSLTWVTIAP